MNDTQLKTTTSIAWLFGTVTFISLILELFLFRIADYNVYRVLNISYLDLLFLLVVLVVQYLLLKKVPIHVNRIWEFSKTLDNQFITIAIAIILASVIYAFIPSQFPFFIFPVILCGLCLFTFISNYWSENPFQKVIILLLFGASLNSSLVFWMHEESNSGRHIRYAQQLAERQDTIAENILKEFVVLEKTIPTDIEKYVFWEKQWIENNYLASNYRLSIEESTDSTAEFYHPILTFDKENIPVYKVYFPDNYSINFKLNADFRRSIYAPYQPFKGLKDLSDFQFAVVNRAKVVLSNSHAFDPYILNVDLPEIGQGDKIELEGFDVLAYRHSDDTFVLIGEPLSEVQVWISNFAFFFFLLLSVVIISEIISLFLLRKKVFIYWQELPIQFRIQIILIGITCSLFFIISTTTFAFLHQNNTSISHERQLYISETLRDEISEEEDQHGWKLNNFSVSFLAKLAERKKCDIDLYNPDGTLIVSSYATAKNSPSPNIINNEIINQLRRNLSLILVERQYAEENQEPYLRTYFGIFQNDQLEGIASVSSFESEIGTSPYISIIMNKLLNVYVFLLLISWGGGLLLIRLLTKPLELLANRLSNFKLGEQNEKLKWKGDDAIGQLISDYNKMVDTVEVTTQELIRSEREGAWQVMAQQIAHEINNRLTPLRLNIQFLTRIVAGLNDTESGQIKRITDDLVDKIDGLSKIATQFKLFAKLDTPEVQPIELKTFIEQFLAEYNQRQEYQYSLKINLDNEQNPVINIDTRHLQEVLNNIISNAENSIPVERKGLIELRLRTENDSVIVEVEDNGSGIDDDLIDSIFDPKFSVTSSQTGLGLPICKRIIEFYQGELSFDTKKGISTCFHITFPFSKN
jgi:signal transduction histidine kinase